MSGLTNSQRGVRDPRADWFTELHVGSPGFDREFRYHVRLVNQWPVEIGLSWRLHSGVIA